MGRQQRRLKEQIERKESRKDKILITRNELGAWKSKVADDTSVYNVEVLMTCFALSLLHTGVCDVDKSMEVLGHIDFLMNRVINNECTLADYIEEMEDLGLIVKAK